MLQHMFDVMERLGLGDVRLPKLSTHFGREILSGRSADI